MEDDLWPNLNYWNFFILHAAEINAAPEFASFKSFMSAFKLLQNILKTRKFKVYHEEKELILLSVF